MKPKAVCLFSGGLDSTTVLYQAIRDEYEPIALTIIYGQRHVCEVQSAKKIIAELGVKQHILEMTLPWGGSSLLDDNIPVPRGRDENEMTKKIPSTYVPARNTIFLSYAASLAEVEGASRIYIGANALDYSGYPDCRPEYLEAMARAIRLGTKEGNEDEGFEVCAPLLRLNKKEIIELGKTLGVPFEKTWSCYVGGDKPCGECDSCLLRAKGFSEAGLTDPALEESVE